MTDQACLKKHNAQSKYMLNEVSLKTELMETRIDMQNLVFVQTK